MSTNTHTFEERIEMAAKSGVSNLQRIIRIASMDNAEMEKHHPAIRNVLFARKAYAEALLGNLSEDKYKTALEALNYCDTQIKAFLGLN